MTQNTKIPELFSITQITTIAELFYASKSSHGVCSVWRKDIKLCLLEVVSQEKGKYIFLHAVC